VIYIGRREFAEAGGLMSYGANIADAWRREINPLHIRRLWDPVAGSCHSAPARANKSWSRYRRPKTERSCIEAYPGKDAQTRQNLTICREKETLRVRIPGLARSRLVESELAARELSVFSSDTDADDWHHRISGQQIIALTMRRLEGLGKGILLLHDIHPATVAALPGLLKALKDNRFRIVQVVPAAPYLIAMANKPKARSLASTLPGEAMIGDDGDRGAQPRWPHVVANVVADSVLPVPDASAFEPDALASEDITAVHWPAQAEAERPPPAKRKRQLPANINSPVARKSENNTSPTQTKTSDGRSMRIGIGAPTLVPTVSTKKTAQRSERPMLQKRS
jgi:hypothetical protein